MFINYRQTDWPFWLLLAAFKYRNQTHSATGHSPFYLTHGYHPFTGVEVEAGSINESARQYAQRMKKISETAAELAALAQKHAKKQWDKHKQPARQYNKGDLVYLDSFHITTDRPNKKLKDKRYGLFEILEKIGASVYKLKLPKDWWPIHPVFNEVLLSPAVKPKFPNQEKIETKAPTITATKPEPEYILDSKWERNVMRYLVKWKESPRIEATWVPRKELEEQHRPMLNEFHQQNPTAPKPHTMTLRPCKHVAFLQPDYDEWDRYNATWARWQVRRYTQGLPDHPPPYSRIDPFNSRKGPSRGQDSATS